MNFSKCVFWKTFYKRKSSSTYISIKLRAESRFSPRNATWTCNWNSSINSTIADLFWDREISENKLCFYNRVIFTEPIYKERLIYTLTNKKTQSVGSRQKPKKKASMSFSYQNKWHFYRPCLWCDFHWFDIPVLDIF